MYYSLNDGITAVDLQMTPCGWNLVILGRDPLYTPVEEDTHVGRVTRKAFESGIDRCAPLAAVHVVNGFATVVSCLATMPDPLRLLARVVDQVDSELNLGLSNTLEVACKTFLFQPGRP